MKRYLKSILHAAGGALLLAAIVGAAMGLWNALIPDIFGWKTVDFWQMLGLMALAHLFFGHLGPLSRWDSHRRLHEQLHGMSHDQRREFIRRRMRSLCDEEPARHPADEAPKE